MQISKAEFSVLEVLWGESPLTVGQVVERLQRESEWHENTIKTLLTRLVKKTAVERYKDGKRYFYRPLLSKDDVLMEETDGFLSQFFGGKMAPFIAHFAKNKKLNRKDIEEIQKILAGMSERHD